MKPVYQTRVGENGNCFQAAVASILDLELEQVPDFCNDDPERWFLNLCDWLRQFNLTAMMIGAGKKWNDDIAHVLKDVHLLAGGRSAVRPFDHEVVYLNGEMVHDPAPEGKGLKGWPKDFILFVATKPEDNV